MNLSQSLLKILSICLACFMFTACSKSDRKDVTISSAYKNVSSGIRRFEWDDTQEIGWIKTMLEEDSIGNSSIEIAEIYFPPGYQDIAHMHELELLYVLDGRLDHIVNGVSHILYPGMLGIVKSPDLVVHRSDSENGVRVLAIWPYGKEIQEFEEEGLREISLDKN